jgi:GTP cyclohydrolase I
MKIELPDELFNEEELANTPGRVQRFYEELKKRHDFNFTIFPNKNPTTTGMVILRNIEFTSLCSHHLLPFEGVAHVGYIPNEWRAGASKLARLVDKYAARPNTQEVMAYQIIEELEEKIKPKGSMVVLIGKHQCMACRGVKKKTSDMVTNEVRGVFLVSEPGKFPKEEFMRSLLL